MTRKNSVVEGWSWLKFNNLKLALDMTLKFYTSVEKGFKEKVRKFWGLSSMFVEVAQKKHTLNILMALLGLIRGNLIEFQKKIIKIKLNQTAILHQLLLIMIFLFKF